jgi:hypothetical protein
MADHSLRVSRYRARVNASARPDAATTDVRWKTISADVRQTKRAQSYDTPIRGPSRQATVQ